MFTEVVILNGTTKEVHTDIIGIQASGGIVQVVNHKNENSFYGPSSFSKITTRQLEEDEIEKVCSPEAIEWYNKQVETALELQKQQAEQSLPH